MYSNYFDYSPYSGYQPFPQYNPRRGLFSLFRHNGITSGIGSLKQKFDWGNFLSNTQKTLNVVNQAIPIFYQIKPIWANAKTMFKIMGALKDDDKEEENITTTSKEKQTKKEASISYKSENQPQFFI